MVDFNLNLNQLFTDEITSVRSDLIPEGYCGELNQTLVQQQVFQKKKKHSFSFKRLQLFILH